MKAGIKESENLIRRKRLLTLAAWLALGGAGWLALTSAQAQAQAKYAVSSAQMQDAMAQRFPMRYQAGGLLQLTLQTPQLRLLPALNRLGTEIVVAASGPALARDSSGSMDIDFSLRYEASDQSIRAHRLRVNSLRLADLPPGPAALLQVYGPGIAEQSLQDVVVHKLRPQDLMLADGLGMQPGSITVTANGLVVGFVPKPLR